MTSLTTPTSTSSPVPGAATTTTKKRSFDVAFLMQPDDKVQQRGQHSSDYSNSVKRFAQLASTHHSISVKADAVLRQMGSPVSIPDDDDVRHSATDSTANEEIDIMTNGNSNSSFGSASNNTSGPLSSPPMQEPAASVHESIKYFRYHQAMVSKGQLPPSLSDLEVHRSAFTKVPHVRLESPPPIAAPLSPDQQSCPSISPPANSVTPPRQFPGNFRPDISFSQFPTFVQHPAYNNGSSPHHPGATNTEKMLKHQYIYRHVNPEQMRLGEMTANSGGGGCVGYGPHQGSFSLIGSSPQSSPSFPPELQGIVRNPAAAAILSTLIPPTIASTFTLTAQNVCAKCNISFRMTSDLVYHMRSHHKNDIVGGDSNRRKREDKLKCPVCNESFRERHHLTRHMTAHQDKESDDAEPTASSSSATRNSSSLASAARRHSHPHTLSNQAHHAHPLNKSH